MAEDICLTMPFSEGVILVLSLFATHEEDYKANRIHTFYCL